jgi:hypothetical protein
MVQDAWIALLKELCANVVRAEVLWGQKYGVSDVEVELRLRMWVRKLRQGGMPERALREAYTEWGFGNIVEEEI